MKSGTESRLTFIKNTRRDKWGSAYALYKCTCGTTKEIRVSHVKSGVVRSCYCRGGHTMRKSRIYRIWTGMINRSHKQLSPDKSYVGIDADHRWLVFDTFLEDMKEGYKDDLTIDRIDNTKGYSKKNCRWVSFAQQQRNKTNNRLISFRGETLCIVEWAEKLQINPKTLYNRLGMGWPVDRAFTTPVRVRG